jgi:hypothetical protein
MGGTETSEETKQGNNDLERTYFRGRVDGRRDTRQTGADREQIMGE